jgi:hypothetical protein
MYVCGMLESAQRPPMLGTGLHVWWQIRLGHMHSQKSKGDTVGSSEQSQYDMVSAELQNNGKTRLGQGRCPFHGTVAATATLL